MAEKGSNRKQNHEYKKKVPAPFDLSRHDSDGNIC
jgi:hypothetical protein